MENIKIKVIGSKQYSILSKSKLKKLFRTEKTRIHSNAELVRFLSKLLRSKYKNNGIIPDVCHQSDFQKDFWKYYESNLDKKDLIQSLTNNHAIITSKQKIKQGIGINYFALLLG